jgi:hypothetical protein
LVGTVQAVTVVFYKILSNCISHKGTPVFSIAGSRTGKFCPIQCWGFGSVIQRYGSGSGPSIIKQKYKRTLDFCGSVGHGIGKAKTIIIFIKQKKQKKF